MVQLPDALALAPLLREPGGAELLALVRLDAAAERATATARIEAVLEDARAAGGLSIYGSGTIGRQALAAARLADRQVRAFLDSNPQRSGTVVDGVEVRGVDDVVPGRSVIVPAIGRAVQAVTRTAHERGALHVLSLSELYFSCRPPAEPEPDYADDLGANWLRYLSLFTRLADARSRAVLAALVRHRRSLDPAPLAEVCERDHPQWFAPELLPRPSGEVFVDGGAFDGDTVRSYVAACGDAYRAIHAFELDPEVAARGRERTADLRAVHFHAVGLSNRSGGAAFRRTGTSSTVAAAPGEGDANAELGRLDDLVPEPISFLKLDVEGEEANALAGAERHLRDEQPVLAIASYHKAHDLWDLPRRVLSSSSAYRLHLRHYTELAYETVLYADAASARS